MKPDANIHDKKAYREQEDEKIAQAMSEGFAHLGQNPRLLREYIDKITKWNSLSMRSVQRTSRENFVNLRCVESP